MVGTYLTYACIQGGVPFWIAVIGGALGTALVGALIERTVLRRMVGQPVFAVIMITIGLLFILDQVITAIWGFEALNLNDPWGVDTVDIGDVALGVVDLWTLEIGRASCRERV